MPLRAVPGSELEYYLIAFDKHGVERDEDGRSLSSEIESSLRENPRTDIFIFSHGWKGDIPAAIEQYDAWTAAMLACSDDLERARNSTRGFNPLLIGFHWPSLPFGDEDLGSVATFSVATSAATPDAPASSTAAEEPLVQQWADRIADTPGARDALRVIFASAHADIEPDQIPREVVRAYLTLDREASMGADGVAAGPDADREPFDPIAAYEDARWGDADFGGLGLGGILAPLQQLSFWQMKARARRVGESGGHRLLRSLRAVAGEQTRIHLMGHSFGCIVVSSIISGPDGAGGVVVDSLFLVQGALSHWSFCSSIPAAPERTGYFHSVVRSGSVRGPILTTRSQFDSAVRVLYPKAAGVAGQVAYEIERLPKYGGIGTFGIRGPGLSITDIEMGGVTKEYRFEHGQIYNLDADGVIRTGRGPAGAHNDIAHPEVAHAFWSAVLA